MDRDMRMLLYVQDHIRTDHANVFWRMITCLGEYGWFWICTVILFSLYPMTRIIGLTAGISLAISSFLTNAIFKHVFHRPRPYDACQTLHAEIPAQNDFSFPSGHTSASFACAFVYLFFLPLEFGIPAMILAALIGFSRIYLGVHYVSDVLAGAILGFLTCAAAVWIMAVLPVFA